MFNWTTGQNLSEVGKSLNDSKNVFSVHCDGKMIAADSFIFDMMKLQTVLESAMSFEEKRKAFVCRCKKKNGGQDRS
jgi:hypothetical protein